MEWKEVTLGEIGTIVGGATPSTKNTSFYDGNIPWLTPKDLSVNSNKYILRGERNITEAGFKSCSCKMLPKGSVLFSSRATIGYVAIVANDMCTNQGFKSVIPNEETDSEFLYYLLKYNKDNIASQGSGTTFAEVSGKTMKEIEVMVPKETEDQRRIASILSSLDRKIELNNKINADLEEMAQAIFKNWFVDFEPFKDGKFVDSELGMIPEGWKVISLNEILDNVSGYSYKGSELQSSNIAMATIKNFERKGGFKTEGYKEIVISKKIKETQFVNMFDVLVAHTDLTQNAEIVGNPAIVLSKGGYEKLIMSMDLTKVISKIDGVTNGLLYCILSTSRFKEHALGYVNGTTVLHMSKKAVPEYTCAFPKDINQIRDLCITLDSIYKRMAVTYDENSRLSLLRDTLLPRLMSGELEVPE